MKYYLIFGLFAFSAAGFAQEQKPEILSPEIQIKTAVLAAPVELRDGVKVYGYDKDGKMVVLREGSNYLICLADDPAKKGVLVSCYNDKLEPFMARGRELSAEGMSEMDKRAVRQQEVEAGTLKMPDAPSMTYIFGGSDENYDKTTGELTDGKFRYVIYIPYATTESTGLPDKPEVPGMPWLMDPGTHRAHIMISPANNK